MFEARIIKSGSGETVSVGLVHIGGEITVVHLRSDGYDNAIVEVEGETSPTVTYNTRELK